MRSTLWFLNRVAAALVGAFVVGCAATLLLAVIGALTCHPECTKIVGDLHGSRCAAYESTCDGFWGQVLITLTWACFSSVVLGTLPGLAALTLTPARNIPWKSLPVLIAATTAGFGMWLVVANVFHMEYGATEVFALLIIPSAAGLLAAFNIQRFPAYRSARV